MSDHAKQILVDAFGRVRELVIDLTDGLTDDIATYRPDPGANSIAWLIWHLSRVQDDHVADLAQVEQVWPEWRERFGLPFGKWATGYGQGPSRCRGRPSERRSPQRTTIRRFTSSPCAI